MGIVRRKIYRDGSRRIVGGVCSGLGFYLSIDSVFVRLVVFLCVFFFGITIPLYVLLWAIIPKARTQIERAEMKGEKLYYGDGKARENKTKPRSRKNNIVSEINSLNSSIVNKIGMFLILFFCCICLFIIFSFSFSFPFVIDVFRNVDFLVRLRYSLTGILVGEKAFSVDVISLFGMYCIPFILGLIHALNQLEKLETKIATFKCLSIAWLLCLVLNNLI